MFRKILIAAGVAVVLALLAIAAFGDNIRKLHGMSADALSGQSWAVAFQNTFAHLRPNPWTSTQTDRYSTFGVDVDTASYAVGRRFLEEGRLPPPDSVRVEEYVNAFTYSYPQPSEGPFAVHLEGAPSPFTAGRHILKVGLQGRHVSKQERKPAHLVFLVDVSGSMIAMDKLPLAQESLRVLVNNLDARDTVALVTYAGEVRDVLPPTPADQRKTIIEAIDELTAGGGTAMGSGFDIAYRHAVRTVSADSVSRVIVLTDGDANLGPNLTAETMLEAVKGYVAEGVTLTVVGMGMGNYRDALLEQLANKGNGQIHYVDRRSEAKRIFQDGLTGTLEVIAKDVKVQLELNPEAVIGYRLLGYENRAIADDQFRDDKVDAGEIGAGHSVTALYEVELAPGAPVESLAVVRVRWKSPHGQGANEQELSFSRRVLSPDLATATTDLRFAVALAGMADVLRQAPQARNFSLSTVLELAAQATEGRADRTEAVTLIRRAQELFAASTRTVPENDDSIRL